MKNLQNKQNKNKKIYQLEFETWQKKNATTLVLVGCYMQPLEW